jgi:hypothetical protein
VQRIHNIADPLQSFSLRVNMSPSVGSLYAGEVKDYATLSGYILFRKPDGIRILGLAPMVSNTVFDMVSSGPTFRISIPGKNRFFEGRNDAPAHSQKQLENLRPVAFLTSLIIEPPDPATDLTLIEEDTSERESVYILLVIRRGEDEPWLLRTLQFDRQNLEIIRQKTFDASGGILSDTRYQAWKIFDGIPFPTMIDIKRPQDHYEVVLNVLSIKMNTPEVTAEKFILPQPPGAEVRQLQ